MYAATRWRSWTLSLCVERDSILDQSESTDQQKSMRGVIAIEGVTVLLLQYNCFITFLQRKTRETECAIFFSLNVQYELFSCEGATTHCCHSVVVQLHLPRCNNALSCFVWNYHRLTQVEGASSSDLHLDVACCLQFSGLFCNRMCSLAGLQALRLCVVFLLFTAI